jgi:hypothetical protein
MIGGPDSRPPLSVPVTRALRDRVDELTRALAPAGRAAREAAEDLVGEVSGPRADPRRVRALVAQIVAGGGQRPGIRAEVAAVLALIPT